jgi:hypothetical protein
MKTMFWLDNGIKMMTLTIVCLMATGIFAADFVEPQFPESSKVPDQSSLVVQLAVVPDHIAFGKPVDFFIRFINYGKKPAKLELDCVAVVDIAPAIRFSLLKDKNNAMADILRGGMDSPQAYLSPGESVVVKITNLLVTPGKHKLKVCHYNSKTMFLSNTVNFVMEEKPLNDLEMKELVDGCEQMLTTAESTPDKDWNWNLLRIRLVYCNPYTIPLIRQHLERSRNPEFRLFLSQTLGDIACAESARDRGFHRDTSSSQFMLERLKTETDRLVLGNTILNMEFFFDSFDELQKKTLKEQILSFLESKDPYIRFEAAINIIDLFPENIPIIEERLNRPGVFDPYNIAIKQRIKQMEEFRKNRPESKKQEGNSPKSRRSCPGQTGLCRCGWPQSHRRGNGQGEAIDPLIKRGVGSINLKNEVALHFQECGCECECG